MRVRHGRATVFRECAHAYLAATRALLVHMQAMQGNAQETSGLVARIETQMLTHGASLVLCRYGDEPYNAAHDVMPHLGPVSLDPISLAKMVAGSAVAVWLAALLVRRRRAPVGLRVEAASRP